MENSKENLEEQKGKAGRNVKRLSRYIFISFLLLVAFFILPIIFFFKRPSWSLIIFVYIMYFIVIVIFFVIKHLVVRETKEFKQMKHKPKEFTDMSITLQKIKREAGLWMWYEIGSNPENCGEKFEEGIEVVGQEDKTPVFIRHYKCSVRGDVVFLAINLNNINIRKFKINPSQEDIVDIKNSVAKTKEKLEVSSVEHVDEYGNVVKRERHSRPMEKTKTVVVNEKEEAL